MTRKKAKSAEPPVTAPTSVAPAEPAPVVTEPASAPQPDVPSGPPPIPTPVKPASPLLVVYQSAESDDVFLSILALPVGAKGTIVVVNGAPVWAPGVVVLPAGNNFRLA